MTTKKKPEVEFGQCPIGKLKPVKPNSPKRKPSAAEKEEKEIVAESRRCVRDKVHTARQQFALLMPQVKYTSPAETELFRDIYSDLGQLEKLLNRS
jgi:hypothetical protein